MAVSIDRSERRTTESEPQQSDCDGKPGASGTAAEESTDPRRSLWPSYSPPATPLFSHGEGCNLHAESGEVYVDFLSGIAVTGFGHAHPHLVKALTRQATKLWHVSNVFRIPGAELLARRLSESCFADRVFFANSGAEAVEAGIKAIRAWQAQNGNPQRFRIIGFSDSFHGRTLAALAAAGNPSHVQHFIPADYGFDQVEWGNAEALAAAIGPATAGIILEPVQGEGGIRSASADFLRKARGLCDEHGLLLMYDEVQCGVGRSGWLFAHQQHGIKPDVMAIAKGLGGGFPVGACLTTEAVGAGMVVGTHGSTFGGNPLAMAVANAVMDLLAEPGLLEEVQRKGAFLQDELRRLTGKHPQRIESVHGVGLMLGVKCIIPNTDLMLRLRENKLLVGKAGSNMIRLLPPLNVPDESLRQAVAIMETALDEL